MRMFGRALALAVVATLACLSATAHAAAAPSERDRAFLRASHELHLADIAMAQLALRKSRTDEIRRHARLFETGHRRLDAEVVAQAKRLRVPLPTAASPAQLQEVAVLSRRSGPAFDDAWLVRQLALHRQSAELGRQQVRAGSDPGVTTLARRAGPVLQAHLSILQETLADRTPDAVEAGASGESNGEPARTAPLGLGLIGVAVVLAAGAMFVLARRRRA